MALGLVAMCGRCWGQSSFLWKPLLDVPNETFEKAFLPSYIDLERDIVQSEQVSVQCRNQIRTALHALSMRRNWAGKLFNSWAKFPPSGTLRGTLTDFGDYDQCLSVDALSPQYCLVDISVPMPQPMPKFHNYYQHSEVLPVNENSNQTHQYLSNGTIYRDLAQVSSVFYYVYIQIGICLPEKCTPQDVSLISNNGERSTGGVTHRNWPPWCTN